MRQLRKTTQPLAPLQGEEMRALRKNSPHSDLCSSPNAVALLGTGRALCEPTLDLIMDDWSHWYSQTKACFEAQFGCLRPSGKY
jgi:hypothetical protein